MISVKNIVLSKMNKKYIKKNILMKNKSKQLYFRL
jgi:hypothetical protein